MNQKIIDIIKSLEQVAENGDEFARGYVIAQVIAKLKELVMLPGKTL